MTAPELARAFGWKRGMMRAKCPVHKSRGLTLQIYADEDRSRVHCFAGCSSDDILASIGITWKETLYKPLDPAAEKAYYRQCRINELYAREQRMQDIRWFFSVIEQYPNGYPSTPDEFELYLAKFEPVK